MKSSDLIETYPGFFVSELREDTLWLKFSGNFFHNVTTFGWRDFMAKYFKRVSAADDVRAVVIHSAYSESGSDEYLRFFLLECCEREIGHFGFSNVMDRYELQRFCNVIDQTILSIARLDKLVIHICRGDVLSLFLNVALASDYRIVTTDTVFHHIFQEIGMLPKGGTTFFLNNMVGASKTRELLLLNRRITAAQALRWGIVDQVVAPQELEMAAVAVARSFGEVPARTFTGIKRLVNYSIRELEDYLAFETAEVTKIGKTSGFADQ